MTICNKKFIKLITIEIFINWKCITTQCSYTFIITIYRVLLIFSISQYRGTFYMLFLAIIHSYIDNLILFLNLQFIFYSFELFASYNNVLQVQGTFLIFNIMPLSLFTFFIDKLLLPVFNEMLRQHYKDFRWQNLYDCKVYSSLYLMAYSGDIYVLRIYIDL